MKYMRYLLSVLLFSAPSYAMMINTRVEEDRIETLKSQVLAIQHLKELIPAQVNRLTESFKKHLAQLGPVVIFKHPARHPASVTFSPDGSKLLTGSSDGSVKLWDVETGNLLHTFQHTEMVLSVSFSPDNHRVLTGSADCTAKLWDIATGNLIHTFQNEERILSVYFKTGDVVLIADSTAKLLDPRTGNFIPAFEHDNSVLSVLFSPNGSRVLTAGSSDGTAKLWDVETGNLIHTFQHVEQISSKIFFSPGGELIKYGFNSVKSVAFSPDGSQVRTANQVRTASSSENAVKLWDVETGNLIHTFQPPSLVSSVSFSPDGSKVLEISSHAKLWDIETGNLLYTFKDTFGINSATFSPDGRSVLTGSSLTTANLWDVKTGNRLHTFQHKAERVSFSPDSSQVLTGSSDKTAKLWDAVTENLIHTFQHDDVVNSVCFSPDGSQVLIAGGNTVKLWHIEEPETVESFFLHLNLNQSELLEAFELAIKERGRMHWNLKQQRYKEFFETFKTFPRSIRQKLKRFIVIEAQVIQKAEAETPIEQRSSSSTTKKRKTT